MIITPTYVLTGTYVSWVDASGNDVAGYAIPLVQGLSVLVFIVLIILGQVLALKIWP